MRRRPGAGLAGQADHADRSVPAGRRTDAFARPLSAQLSKQLGRQVIIDNRGGAGGTVGASIAAKAAPDGYTFFVGAVHHAIAPSFYPKLDYNIETDLVPLTVIANPPQIIVINPSRVKVDDFKAFMTLLRASPGKLNYASAGNGTSHHLAGELFKQQSNTFIVHIPYRGAGPALQDLIAGNVDMMFDGLGSSAQHIRAGRIKALAVAAPKRSPAFLNVPTTAEVACPITSYRPGMASGRERHAPADSRSHALGTGQGGEFSRAQGRVGRQRLRHGDDVTAGIREVPE